MVWGKPQIQIVQNPSDEFGDLEGMNRTDESKLISNLKTCTSGATANNQAKNPDSFIFFTEIPEPYVGLVWVPSKSLPAEGGYLSIVIAKRGAS